GREAYLECLTVQLVSIHNRDNPTAAAPQDALDAPPSENRQSSVGVPKGQAVSWLSPLWIGIGIVTLIAATGGALFATKARGGTPRAQDPSVSRNCRVCGADILDGGDLCPKCRREAADALRQAAASRLQNGRALAPESTQQAVNRDEGNRHRAYEEEA